MSTDERLTDAERLEHAEKLIKAMQGYVNHLQSCALRRFWVPRSAGCTCGADFFFLGGTRIPYWRDDPNLGAL